MLNKYSRDVNRFSRTVRLDSMFFHTLFVYPLCTLGFCCFFSVIKLQQTTRPKTPCITDQIKLNLLTISVTESQSNYEFRDSEQA